MKLIDADNLNYEDITDKYGQSKGTQHSFDLAKQYNNPILVIKYKE